MSWPCSPSLHPPPDIQFYEDTAKPPLCVSINWLSPRCHPDLYSNTGFSERKFCVLSALWNTVYSNHFCAGSLCLPSTSCYSDVTGIQDSQRENSYTVKHRVKNHSCAGSLWLPSTSDVNRNTGFAVKKFSVSALWNPQQLNSVDLRGLETDFGFAKGLHIWGFF